MFFSRVVGLLEDGLCPISLRADNLDNDPERCEEEEEGENSSLLSCRIVILFVKIATHKHGMHRVDRSNLDGIIA